jgi:putative phosphoribosyl transferase
MREQVFNNRLSAGRALADALEKFKPENPVVLGIPRGGVIVAAEVAAILGCDFDLIIPRKIGAPGNPELAIGAVAGEDMVLINEDLADRLGASKTYLNEEIRRQNEEIRRRRRLYFGDAPPIDLTGRTALVVDDGLATGYTALAAVRAVREARPAKIVLAVPVGPVQTVSDLRKEVDEMICLYTPEPFFAVGQFYAEFAQVTDEEVVDKLKELRAA